MDGVMWESGEKVKEIRGENCQVPGLIWWTRAGLNQSAWKRRKNMLLWAADPRGVKGAWPGK